jgi:allantoin racemase
MQEQLGVPVLDGVACAVKLAEGLNGYGVTTSKVAAYKDPERKELLACPGSLAPIYERAAAAL